MIYNITQGVKQLTQKHLIALNRVSALLDALYHRDIPVFKYSVEKGYMHETIFITDGTQTLKIVIEIQRWKESE